MTPIRNAGWRRLLGAVAGFGAVSYAAYGNIDVLTKSLYWVEYTSKQPGLSGVIIVVGLIAAFVGGCFLVGWIASGFRSTEE